MGVHVPHTVHRRAYSRVPARTPLTISTRALCALHRGVTPATTHSFKTPRRTDETHTSIAGALCATPLSRCV